ncbi:MAG: methionine biosynthesis protein MetW [Acidimicrobiales bacterium]
MTQDRPAIDLAKVQAEINEEVKRRRAAGDFPAGLERELDALFARYVPAGAGENFDDVMVHAETQSFVHADVPTGATIPGLSFLKRFLRRLMAWYVRFLTAQITSFAGAITRAVRLLGERVDTVEAVTVLAANKTLAEIRDRRAGPDLSAWTQLVVSELRDSRGRVLHTECGSGALLAGLAEAGADVYGVEPVERLVMEASRVGLDVRADDALAHLRALPAASLGALVLSGAVDALPLGGVLELADHAASAVVPGGVTIVLSCGAITDPVIADLAPGRPLHPETWVHLLSERGYDQVTVHGEGAYAVVARRPG